MNPAISGKSHLSIALIHGTHAFIGRMTQFIDQIKKFFPNTHKRETAIPYTRKKKNK